MVLALQYSKIAADRYWKDYADPSPERTTTAWYQVPGID